MEGNERMLRSLGVTQGGQERVAIPKCVCVGEL